MSKFIKNRIIWLTMFLFLLIFNVESTVCGVKKALNICATAIVPSLFIFMVFANVLVAAISESVANKISPKIIAFFIGSFCGFPIGASICKTFCDNKIISPKDAALIIPYCNNASFGFTVGAVGLSFWENEKLGYVLFISQFLASLIPICFIKVNYKNTATDVSATSHFEMLLNSIEKSVKNIFNICGLICIFSAFLEILENFSITFTSVFLEISNGVSYCSSLKDTFPCLSFVLCGFCCGFSGICVLLQIKSVFKYKELTFNRLISRKIMHGLITAIFSFIGYFFVTT